MSLIDSPFQIAFRVAVRSKLRASKSESSTIAFAEISAILSSASRVPHHEHLDCSCNRAALQCALRLLACRREEVLNSMDPVDLLSGFIIALRIFSGLGWRLITFPVLIGAFFAGQF